MNHARLFTILALSTALGACGGESEPLQVGAAPKLPPPDRGLLPDMVIAEPAEWGDKAPIVPEGYTVTAIATDLKIPRQTLVLPNGDILVAEGRGGNEPSLKPKDGNARVLQVRGTRPVKGGHTLTVQRAADG